MSKRTPKKVSRNRNPIAKDLRSSNGKYKLRVVGDKKHYNRKKYTNKYVYDELAMEDLMFDEVENLNKMVELMVEELDLLTKLDECKDCEEKEKLRSDLIKVRDDIDVLSSSLMDWRSPNE